MKRRYFLLGSLCLVIILIALLFVGLEFQRPEIGSTTHGDRVKAIEPILQAYECSAKTTIEEVRRCENNFERMVEWATSFQNLAAQDTIASANQGLLLVGLLHACASFITLFFLFWTVAQTGDILRQSELTADYTKGALFEARRATNYQLKPYLSCRLTDVDLVQSHSGAWLIEVKIRVYNNGATPATYVCCEFDGGDRSGILCKRVGPVATNYPVFFSYAMGNRNTNTEYIGANSHMDMKFHCLWKLRDSETWVETKKSNSDVLGLYYVDWIQLSALELRYKDLECEETQNHKLLKGPFGFYPINVIKSQNWMVKSESRPDGEHWHFKD